MLNDWFREIELPMSRAQFQALPRHPAYQYEYARGAAVLSPAPRYGRGLLDLGEFLQQPPPTLKWVEGPFQIRGLSPGDWELLPGLMAGAFQGVPPFSALDEQTALAAAADCIRTTRTGGDGPVVHEACFVAVGSEPWESPVGAVLVTLIPRGDLTQWHGASWLQAPPAGRIEPRLGRPHLTWIFVSAWHTAHGLGSALLRATAERLTDLGYDDLATTTLIGNDRAMAWHWRNGFRLLQHPGSPRRDPES